MSEIININTTVVGTDDHTPILLPNSDPRIWFYNQIYRGQEGRNKYIPKVGDLVVDSVTRRWYIVIEVPENLVARLDDWVVDSSQGEVEDAILGTGLDSGGETFRLFVDRRTIPYRCIVDQRAFTGALHASYAIAFRGNPYDGSAEKISMLYDASNNFLGHEVPLRKVAATKYTNEAIRTVEPFRTTYDLTNHEPITLMYFGPEGEMIHHRNLIVQHSDIVDHTASDERWIASIELDSPYLLESEPNVIELPINLLTNSMNAMGIVRYTDGSSLELPAQGGRFEIHGLQDFIAAVPNLEIPIQLKYNLVPGEVATSSIITDEPFIKRGYRLRTGQAKNAYSVKLYCWPVWVDSSSGYRLEWYLYNLERKVTYRVDHLIRYNLETNPAFNPTAYGVNQRISVSVDLNKVSGQYNKHIHTQVMEVLLQREATDPQTPWTLRDYGAEPLYGENLQATYEQINQNLKYLYVGFDAANQTEWLQRLYWNTVPLYDRFSESKAPTPNYFVVEKADDPSFKFEIPIEDWAKPIQFSSVMQPYTNVNIRFILRTPDNDAQLSMASMLVRPK